MSVNTSDKAINIKLNRQLEKTQSHYSDAIAKISSGDRFAGSENLPSERSISDSMEYRIRSISASKRNINDAVSLLQTAESTMSEMTNTINRMKEINISATNSSMSDQERRFLLIEYDGLYDEINRVVQTTEFNGIPLLNVQDKNYKDELIFRVDDPYIGKNSENNDEDLNVIRLTGLKDMDASTAGLGLKSAKQLLSDSNIVEGISIDDARDLLTPDDTDIYSNTFDQALDRLMNQRTAFGSLQSRIDRSLDFLDVYQENIQAAKSKIADTDYAQEISNMLQDKISIAATTSLLTQANISQQSTLMLLQSLN